MLKPTKSSLRQRIGEADPVFSMGQRVWDWITYAWGPITLAGLWSAAVSAAAYFSDWWQWLGPPGVVLLALGVFLISLTVLCILGYIRALVATRRLERSMLEEWQVRADQVNPLDREFHTKRIKVMDLANPVTRMIANKRFIDCELMGPANIILMATAPNAFSMTGTHLNNCDVVVIKDQVMMYNVIALEDSTIFNGKIFNCTIYIPQQMVPAFSAMNASFLTLTGDPAIDKI